MLHSIPAYILVIALSWLSAHFIKILIGLIKNRKTNINILKQLFISGGMPSSHSATALSVWMLVLLREGIYSDVFGLATLFALVICYDAVKVRRSVGEQGEALRDLIKSQNFDIALPRAARGHTPSEVIVGAILGLLIGLVVYITT